MKPARKIALLKRELERAKRERLAEIRAEIESTRLRINAYTFQIEKNYIPK